MKRTLRCGLVLAAVSAVSAGWSQNYAQTKLQIKAGILYTNQGVPATPHVFYNLNKETSLKPAGWEFVNPRSPSIYNDALAAVWGVGTLSTGTRVDKSQAGYWEVNIDDSSDAVLAGYDVLLLPIGPTGVFRLSPIEREKLRRFVDQGGTLWIDYNGASSNVNLDFLNPSPASLKLAAGSGTLQIQGDHPLLNTPQFISYEEVDQLRQGKSVLSPIVVGDLGSSALYNQWLYTEFGQFNAVAGLTGNKVYVATRKVGDGNMVVSSLDLASALNGDPSNTGYMAQLPTYNNNFYAAEKFVINMISLNNGYSTSGQGGRRTSSSPVNVNAPMLQRYTVPGTPENGGSVLYKGRLVTTGQDPVTGNTVLMVLDAVPGRDLDGDGNPDDGVPDGLASGGRDIIWEAPLTGQISAITCTEVNGTDYILFTDASGALNVYTLLQGTASKTEPAYAVVPPPVAPDTPATSAPTVHEGVAYIADSISTFTKFGRVWAVDLTLGTPAILTGGTGTDYMITRAAQFNPPSGPATVGYIPILDNSGGVDKVLYVPMTPDPTSQRSAGLCSIWLGAKGEKPRTIQAGTTLTIQPRALDQQCAINSTRGFKLTFVHIAPGGALDGVPFTQAEMAAALSGNPAFAADGTITVNLSNASYDFSDGGNTSCRIDYEIDLSASQSGTANPDTYVRGNVYFPDNVDRDLIVKGGVALAPNGNIFVAVGHQDQSGHDGGSFYCLKEEGRGDFKVIYRWALYKKLTNQIPYSDGLTAFNYDEAVVDYDPIVDIVGLGILDQHLTKPQFNSSPVVRGDKVFVNASWSKSIFGFNLPVTSTLAFKVNPGAAEFFVSNPPSTFVLAQADPDRTDTSATSYKLSALQPGLFDVNANVSTGVSRVTLDNMAATRRGQIQDCIAVNLPVIIRAGGSPDIKIEPEAVTGTTGSLVPGNAGGRWNPMLWQACFEAFGTNTHPIVAGNTMYLAGNSWLPNFLVDAAGTLQNISGSTPWGFMYGLDPNLSQESLLTVTANKSFMNSNYGPRTWVKEFKSVTGTPGVWDSIRSAPEIKWPSYYGIQSFDDFRIRTLQASLRNGHMLQGVIAGENQIVVWDDTQSTSFSQADFFFADAGRIGRIDAAGNPIWLDEATIKRGENARGSEGETVKLSRPWRVYPSGDSAYWVVDAGQDRLIRVDQTGRELRSIEGMRIDPLFKPAGLDANPVKSLRMPRDVYVYSDVVLAANNPFSNPQAAELWRHYVIADQGNYRILELVDRYAYNTATGQTGNLVFYNDNGVSTPALGVAFSHSAPELSGKQFAYNSINQLVAPDGSYKVFAYGFGNIEPARADFGLDAQNAVTSDVPSGYGGFVVWDPARGKQAVVTSFLTGSTQPNCFYNPVSNAWDKSWTATQVHKIAGLQSVTMRYDINGNLLVMITTSEGVFELQGDSTTSQWNCVWALPAQSYTALKRTGLVISPSNPLGFKPSFARRLDSGDVLIVNAYVGSTLGGGLFKGEVLVVDGTTSSDVNPDPAQPGFNYNHVNLGFNTNAIKLEIPPAPGMRPLAQPVFADRR